MVVADFTAEGAPENCWLSRCFHFEDYNQRTLDNKAWSLTQQSGEKNGIYMLIPYSPMFNPITIGLLPGGEKLGLHY